MIVTVYIEDLLIYAKTDQEIDTFISALQHDDINLQCKGTAEGYLGVNITTNDTHMHLMQSGLTQRIITAMELSKYSNSCLTPAKVSPLPKDINGESSNGTINYTSIIGMLLYLAGRTRPDSAFCHPSVCTLHIFTNQTP